MWSAFIGQNVTRYSYAGSANSGKFKAGLELDVQAAVREAQSELKTALDEQLSWVGPRIIAVENLHYDDCI
jgi:hypothetical protein